VQPDDLAPGVRSLMDEAWRLPGFCVPNAEVYPHQWLWDSCFHALIWQALGDRRGVVELGNVLAHQERSGFVPHMTYWHHPDLHETFWGRRVTSSITQPPMFAHAARRLTDGGHEVPGAVVDSVEAGLRYLLLQRPRTAAGLIPIVHPWESGCDDSPRWDSHRDPARSWREVKGDLVADLASGRDQGAGIDAPGFRVGSIGFNALVAWNTLELLQIRSFPDGDELAVAAHRLIERIRDRWDPSLATWVDDGRPSGQIRTLDTMSALLVDPRSEAFDQLVDAAAFGAPFGPRGVHRDEPTYQPDVYWRGPAWPQLSYLMIQAAAQSGRDETARTLARSLVAGATTSAFAEYWHPDTGEGLGARPQSWSGLALVVARDLQLA